MATDPTQPKLFDNGKNGRISQDEINGILWKACDTFRGTVDPSEYKNYILVMLFVKYISDVWQDHYDQLKEKFGGDEERIERQLRYERFVLPAGCRFADLYAQRNADNLGEVINIALEKIEEANKPKLSGVFRNIDFNSEAALGRTRQRNERLQHLLDDFADKRLDLRPSRVGNMDIIGNAYEYLIGRFAAGAGKKAGEFYTPPEVSTLLAQLLDPQPGERICDPACGSGSLLIKCAQQVGSDNYAIYAQENNGSTWALAVMNVFLHNINVVQDNLKWTDTLRSPTLLEEGRLMRFNVVVANPPFSLDKWGASTAENDPHRRFWRGIPPKSVGDYAFISHMIETTYPDPSHNGRVGVIVPHGVLFRGGAEGKIRQALIEENLLDAVIGLPPNLFYGTGIPAAILIFKRNKADNRVLFIDASRGFEAGSNQNRLRETDIERILTTYRQRQNVSKYAYLAAFEEIKENDFNLNIPRYVDTFEEEEEIDLGLVQAEIEELEQKLAGVQGKLAGYLRELGLN
ncbi:MAG: type I restriction-modification system subunit M [Anaerolineae bacterium]|nr:type I restriction-modification system subunit M [Anaerolineales bacterium]MCQ3972177.1 type I restriction-modification system subunit M [Anaerolineae bacterium]